MLEILLTTALLMPAMLAQQQTDTTFAAAGATTLRVDNMNGSVTVRGWTRDRIRVRATHGARDHMEIHRSGSDIRIEPESRHGAPGTVRIEIDVPAAMALRIEGVYNHTQVEDVSGALEIETVDGNIAVRGGRGRIELESVQGSITVDGANGQIDASSVNNGIRITNSSGPIAVETVNGPITLAGIRSTQVEANSVNGALTYQGTIERGGRYYLASHNGDVQISLPAGTNADLVVSTFNGEFEVDFPVQVREREARGRFQLQLGSGGARVELESFGGSVRLLRTRDN
jgi:hypothetical protein